MSRRCDYAVYQATVVTNGVFLCYSVCVCLSVYDANEVYKTNKQNKR